MNTILQKQIEEAANITVQNLYDYAKQTRNPEVSKYDEGYLDAIDVQGDFLFREGANYALSNQWISVDEALPSIREKDIENRSWSDWVLIRTHKGGAYLDSYIFHKHTWTNNGDDVTHWMNIPPTINK